MISGAQFSEDRIYRYALWRIWDEGKGRMMVIGLNPSTADETVDDPTIRRCIGFAKKYGYGGIDMLNIYAFRATDPKELKKSPVDIIGLSNYHFIKAYADCAARIVAAWGNHGLAQGQKIMDLLSDKTVYCFGTTKTGCPKHPLYLKGDTELIVYREDRG